MNRSWNAATLKQEDIFTTVSDDLINAVKHPQFRENGGLRGDQRLLEEVAKLEEELESGTGAKVVTGLPVTENQQENETFFLNFLSLFGSIVYQNNIGNLISHVTPANNITLQDTIDKNLKGNDTDKQTNNRPYQTNEFIEFHTDLSDVAGLFCINSAKEGGDSCIVSSIAIYERLKETEPEILDQLLMKPFYIFHQTPNTPDGNNHLIQIPMLSFEQGYFSSFMLGTYVKETYKAIGKQLDPLAERGIDLIQELAADESLHVRFRLEPGNLMLLNNHVTYHSRESFIDDQDKKRHMFRGWVSTSNNRPLSALYSELYGNDRLKNGDFRGGFERLFPDESTKDSTRLEKELGYF